MEEDKLWTIKSNAATLDNAKYVDFDHSLRKVVVPNPFDDKKEIVDYNLFPYTIKNRDLFYQRDHPNQLNPESYSFKSYWEAFAKKAIEGIWVDDDGTWVYMPSKLFFFINYIRIIGNIEGDETKRTWIQPDLSSLEWFQSYYVMIADGFSGFEGDLQYTCNALIKKLSEGNSLSKYEQKKIDNCYTPKGDLKIYVDPWEYLTRFYLIDNPFKEPMGLPLYENNKSNALVSGSRGVAKSVYAYCADFIHTWTFGGARKYSERKEASTRMLFAAASGAKDPLNRSLKMIKGFYDSQPGKFRYPSPDRPDYMGPFYKKVQGAWEAGSEIQHLVKEKSNTDAIVGSSLQMNVVTPDRKKIGAGDRFIRIYVEEAGLIEYLDQIHSTNKDSMEVGEVKVGTAYYTGTAGDLIAIESMKRMMLNPEGYQMASIYNYWKGNGSYITLFLSAMYKYRNLKDPQGNNDCVEALKFIQEDRVKASLNMDSSSFDDHILNNPISPDEMLRPNRRSFLPVNEAQRRLADIEDYKYDVLNTSVGDLVWDKGERYGVSFYKDMVGKLTPLNDYNIDRQKIDISGAYQIYEHPPEYIPENLFWIVFDPVSKPGQGLSIDASLNCAIVYKAFYRGNENTLEDSIVADWMGRLDDLEETYERVIKLAKYYNAKIFPETNTPGFVDYCKRNGYFHMLQPEAYAAEREINPNFRKRGAVGFSVYGEKKTWLLQWFKSWLLKKRNHNLETGEFDSINIDHILPKRLLNEIINFNEQQGNYDYISCMLGLMLLIVDIRENAPVKMYQDEDVVNTNFMEIAPKPRKRSSFEQLIY